MTDQNDWQQIADVLTRYAVAVDHDLELWDEVFAPDAFLDYTEAGGYSGTSAEVKETTRGFVAAYLAAQHMLGNFAISVVGDEATARSSVRALVVMPGTEEGLAQVMEVVAFYDDRLARLPSGWRIVDRKATVVWYETRTAPIPTEPAVVLGSAARRPLTDVGRAHA